MSAVVPVLYRHVARLARLHDRDPALKALLLLVPTREYDWRERRWQPRWKAAATQAPRPLRPAARPASARASSGRPPAAVSLG